MISSKNPPCRADFSLCVPVAKSATSRLLSQPNVKLSTHLCFQMNEVLNVADLATQTIATGAQGVDASLASVNAAITNIVNKLNEILKKGTNTC